MKLKCTVTGQIWDIDHIAASQGIRVSTFFSNYELIPDEPQSSYGPHARIDMLREAINHNTRSIENLTIGCNSVLGRVMALESDNQRLKDRLNKIESSYTQGEP